ncbi:hypothetical protein AZI87_01600 [Bdellovibrio bacteriovorus]|uniref:Sigma-54 factor interaction domain-containing protein n=1 Tax=Bdellovibrio bacteriovorus TaxID=959 RepID=A0A162GF17_BDEBC|nr:sigma-54 dependent transcriptional regulator [Bdellovibrio bacteriovorus]KYG67992.1 hypothetical protein AZI87_01600 [Bdellovibrio bacteriovorus]
MSQVLSQDFQSHNIQLQRLINSLPRIAQTDANILIQGESGTGKEMLARTIHRLSPRASRPLLAVNCSAIPEALFESELFGHRRGSFTGAVNDYKGIFEAAKGGTVFLDEIGDLPLHLQSKLLRVLQERTVRPVGATSEYKVEFNIISATHKNLKQEIKEGKFREDLYYRLNVIPITLPPLRERKEDIPNLINKFITIISEKYSNRISVKFSEDAIKHLINRPWSGNIRELENYIERAVVLNLNRNIIGVKELPETEENQTFSLGDIFKDLPNLENLQNTYVHYVLESVNYHQGRAAEILGVSRRTISRKLNQKWNSNSFKNS